MMDRTTLQNRAAAPARLTERQETAAALVERYVTVAEEWPSSAWLARRMSISRKRAWEHMDAIRQKLEASRR